MTPESRTFEVRPVELRMVVRRLVKRQPPADLEHALTDLGWSIDDAADFRLALDEAYNQVCASRSRRR